MRTGKWGVIILGSMMALLIVSCLFSAYQFDTFNAPATFVGLTRVCLGDAPFAQIGFIRPAYLGNPENGYDLFLSTMADMGYIHHPEEQMGALHWFEDADGNWVKVLFHINAYYSRWVWC